MKEKRARTLGTRLGLEVPDVLLPDTRDHLTLDGSHFGEWGRAHTNLRCPLVFCSFPRPPNAWIFTKICILVVGVSRGNTIRGNRSYRTERFWEGNLPLRGSERISEREGYRGFQRFSEVFGGFERFWEVFRGFSKTLSETLSECHFPLRVAGRVAH